MINLKNISFKYAGAKELSINNINLEIKKGELIVILGGIGAGKTTLTRCINGLIPHFIVGRMKGNVLINDINTKDYSLSEIATKVGLILDNPIVQLTGYGVTVEEEVAFGMENLGVERIEIKKRVKKLMDLLDITELKNKNPFEISGGQQQSVAIASILGMEPKILILDEPTSQLDPRGTIEIFDELKKLKRKQTIILVTQKVNLIRGLADRIVVMNKGKIVKIGKPGKILNDYSLLKKNNIEIPALTELLSKVSKKNATKIKRLIK